METPALALYSAGCTYPKSRRLLKKLDFKRVLENGHKAVSRDLVMIALPTAVSAPSRLGLIVSKKVGNAVVRNRVKRQLREIFRHAPSADQGWDVVVIARVAASQEDYQHLAASFAQCYSRLQKNWQRRQTQ